jgi:DNA-binding response OmpR family regulator
MTSEKSERVHHRFVVIGPVLSARDFCDAVLAQENTCIVEDVAEASRMLGTEGITAAILLSVRNARDDRSALELAVNNPAFDGVPIVLIGAMSVLSESVDAIRIGAAGVLPERPTMAELEAVVGFGPADVQVDLAIDRSTAGALERTLHLLRSLRFTGTVGSVICDERAVLSFVKGRTVGTRFRDLRDEDALAARLQAASKTTTEFTVNEVSESTMTQRGRAQDVSVVLIDDDVDTLRVYAKHLETAGALVVTASTPEEGFAAAQRIRPDVVVTDLHMPRVDGWRLLSDLRSTPATADARLVLFSSLHEAVDDLERSNVDTDAFVKKDGHSRPLVDAVAGLGRPRAVLRQKLNHAEPVTTTTEEVPVGAILAELASRPGWHLVIVDDDWERSEIYIEDGRFAGARASGPNAGMHDQLNPLCEVGAPPGGQIADQLGGIAALCRGLSLRPARIQVVALPWTTAAAGEPILTVLDRIRTSSRVMSPEQTWASAGSSLVFDRKLLRVYCHRVTLDLMPILAALSRGETPKSLVDTGVFDADLMERLVVDLMRRGVARLPLSTFAPQPSEVH